MADYVKIVDFAAKDLLASGNAGKRVLGAELDAEYNAIATMSQTKEDSANKNVASGYAPLDAGILVPVANLPAATEAAIGAAELATQAETNTGTDDERIVTPLKLASRTATEARAGVIELATQVETDAGTDDARAVTPLKLANTTAPGSGFVVYKTADELFVSDATLNQDGDLNITIPTTANYALEALIMLQSVNNNGQSAQFRFSESNGTVRTGTWHLEHSDDSPARIGGLVLSNAATYTAGIAGDTDINAIAIRGHYFLTAADSFGLDIAQAVSDADGFNLLEGSWIRLIPMT